MHALELQELTKAYPPPLDLGRWLRGKTPTPRLALEKVSLTLGQGEVLALVGPNGAGKSTLLRVLCGLLRPDAGVARVCGLDVVEDRPRCRATVGAVLSEDRGLSPRLTARQNLVFFGALHGLSCAQVEDRLLALAARFEAASVLDRPVRTLSSGQRARVVLVRALLHQPKLVLLDEPSRSLDPGAAARLRQELLSEVRERGASVVISSHDLYEVQALGAQVAVLDASRLCALGSFAEVLPTAEAAFARAQERS